MKLSFSFLWTTILLVSVLVSCTIEKRLYRPGYHVEWSTHARSVNETETGIEKQVADQHIQSEEKHAETLITEPDVKEEIAGAEETHRSSVVSTSRDHADYPIQHQTVNNSSNHELQTETLDESNDPKPMLKKTNQREHNQNGFIRGLLLVLIGLLLIGLGLLFNSVLGVFGTVLLIIFGLGGAIMVIIGLFVMTFG